MGNTEMVEDVDLLYPELLMQPSELQQARRCFAAIRKDRQKNALREVPLRPSPVVESAIARLRELSADVLRRELGLEVYMVLHIRREGGYEVKFQALTIDLMNDFGCRGGQWAWHLDGRSLRKDGTIGERRVGVGFNIARVDRRRLDGSWVRLNLAE